MGNRRRRVVAGALAGIGVGALTLGAFSQELPTPQALLAPSEYDARDDVFYQIMPISWRYAKVAGLPGVAEEHRFGNFAGMTESIGYLKGLGVTAVWMTPIFPSAAYHGYQHDAADRVNPWFGEEAEFWRFVAAAKGADIKVYLDLVTYGISQQSEYFRSAKGDPTSPYAEYFAFTDAAHTRFLAHSYRTWNGDPVAFVNWDLRTTGVRELVIKWSKHWLDPNGDGDCSDGIAGFRLDHVWARYKPEGKPSPGGWGYNIDGFWAQWKSELVKLKPDVFTFAEQAKWETWGTDLMPAHDATFTKPFEGAAREALRSETAAALYAAMAAAVKALPEGRTFLSILGDHDVDRLASAIGADEPGHEGRARAAAAVLMLQPFPPIVYYGDELGMLGKKGNFGNDANDIPRREPMKWLAVEGAPMTRYLELDPRTVEKQYSKDRDGRSVEEQGGVKGSLLETYRELVRLRRGSIALRRGSYEGVASNNPAVWKFRRVHAEQVVEVSINLSGKSVGALSAYGYVVVDRTPKSSSKK